MPFVRNAFLALISSFILVTTGFAAGSGDSGWKLLQAVGEVTVGGEGLQPVAVRRNDFVPLDGWVQTGNTGRAVLVRGGDTVIVAPGSRVKLPSERVNGNTQILQSLGSVFYSVSKQKAPHFQVDTPYMAAVVKGTSFVITVADERSRIDVTEGLVEVSNTGRADVEFVRPGFSATVAHALRDSDAKLQALEVTETSALPPLPSPAPTPAEDGAEGSENGADTVAGADSKRTQALSVLKVGSDKQSSEDSSSGVITAAIGEALVDVASASGGLVRDNDPPVGRLSGTSVAPASTSPSSASAGSASADAGVREVKREPARVTDTGGGSAGNEGGGTRGGGDAVTVGRDGDGIVGGDGGTVGRDGGTVGRDGGTVGRDGGAVGRDGGTVGRDGGAVGEGHNAGLRGGGGELSPRREVVDPVVQPVVGEDPSVPERGPGDGARGGAGGGNGGGNGRGGGDDDDHGHDSGGNGGGNGGGDGGGNGGGGGEGEGHEPGGGD
jgi:hypothetical protein